MSPGDRAEGGQWKVNAEQAMKQKVYQAIEGLSPESFEEFSHFLDFLKFKLGVQQPRQVVALAGLWVYTFRGYSDHDLLTAG